MMMTVPKPAVPPFFTITGCRLGFPCPILLTQAMAVIAQHSPLLLPFEERVIAHCSVDAQILALRQYEKARLIGRDANEVSATGIVAGASSESAAGSIVESISKLVGTIDANEIMKK